MNPNFEPKWIAWEITKKCNLNCVHCRSYSTIPPHPPLSKGGWEDFSTELAYKIIDDISGFARPVIVLSGGEPLLRGDVFDIARYGTKKGLRMCLATNGTLVTDDVCKKIAGSGIKIVSLSIDGTTKEAHDTFRKQSGAFRAVIKAAKLFKKHGIEFLINSSFTKRNQGEIKGTYELAKKLGATAWYMFLIVPTGRGRDLTNELISKDDYEEILEWHYNMERGEKDIIVRPTCAPHYFRIISQKSTSRLPGLKAGACSRLTPSGALRPALKRQGLGAVEGSKGDGEKFVRRSLKFSTGTQKGCIAGQYIAFIDAQCSVLPCSYFPVAAGNLKERTFKEIWEDSKLMNELRDFKKYKGKCGMCEFINACGGCRARAYSTYGDYLEEEPFCKYSPPRLRRGVA